MHKAPLKIARVIVDISLDREFDYEVPEELGGKIMQGSRVLVPFGKSVAMGYVVGFCGSSDFGGRLKAIDSVLFDKPLISENILKLARWMADYYCAPIESAVRTVLPGAVRRKKSGFRKQIIVSAGRATDIQSDDVRLTAGQRKVLDVLHEKGALPMPALLAAADCGYSPVKSLAARGLVVLDESVADRKPLSGRNILPTSHLALMDEQAAALEMIGKTIHDSPVCGGGARDKDSRNVTLLYGVTGSGKTEVYLQAIDIALSKGLGAIVLVPEISLTPQTIERFVGRFGERVAVLHSHLSDGERHDEWHRIRRGGADIVVGARSAVFAPLARPGLIIVDEEHEPSYKQDEAPRYNARDVAVMRGMIEGCAVVLGSATPALESWFNVGRGKFQIARLDRRADNRRMPDIRVIDMRLEIERTGHANVMSAELSEAMRSRLDRGEQTILFINRRGYSASLLCPKCGYVAKCENCSVSCTYHRSDETLKCHICGAVSRLPGCCPGCKDPVFRFAGIGTQRVERVVQKFFPHARVQRIDADVTGTKDAYERILGDFRSGRTDILIGTQMIAKGLHFPNVTLVGIIYADLSLHVPDFRAGERTFQLLAQVAGRAGRGDVPGEVIVQTYTPFHVAVQCARRQDFDGFCDQEIEFRKELGYPPFTRLVCLSFRGADEARVHDYARKIEGLLGPAFEKGVIMSEAVPAPLSRVKGLYRYQIMIRAANPKRITVPLREKLRGVKVPADVSLSVDVDALNLM